MSKTKSIILISGIIFAAICLISCCCISAYVYMFDNSFFGRGCLYDDGNGFTSLSNGQSFTAKDGTEVRCVNGKVEF